MTITDAVASLIRRFPNRNVGDDRDATTYLAEYVEDLSDLPEELVVAAILRLRKTNTFMPQVAEIRELVVEAVCGLPSEEQAWKAVRAAMAAFRPDEEPNSWQRLHPLIQEIVGAFGTWALRNDEKGIIAASFRKLYRERRAALVGHMVAGAMPLPELPSGDRHAAIVPLRIVG